MPNGKLRWTLDDLWRRRVSTPVAQLQGFAAVGLRFKGAEACMRALADRLALPRPALNGDDFNLLAGSGGAAGATVTWACWSASAKPAAGPASALSPAGARG